LQEALDIHVLRDLEDLIIDAMYQDVVRGKLDQQQGMFEVEWAMGRDMKTEEIQGLLIALNNWSRMAGALLESMDKKIKKIKVEQAEGDSLRTKNNAILRERIKEVSERIQPPTANRTARKGRIGEPSAGSLGDAMDVDDRGIPGLSPRNAGSASSSLRIQ
jgi:COP9 signalosome complex subunit 7